MDPLLNMIPTLFNYGLPSGILVIFIWKIAPAMEKLGESLNSMSVEIAKLKEVQESLRELIITGKKI